MRHLSPPKQNVKYLSYLRGEGIFQDKKYGSKTQALANFFRDNLPVTPAGTQGL